MFSPVVNSSSSVIKGQFVCFSVQGWKTLIEFKFNEENRFKFYDRGSMCSRLQYLPAVDVFERLGLLFTCQTVGFCFIFFSLLLGARVCAPKCRAGTSPLLAAHLPNIVCSLSPETCFSAQSPTRASSSTFTRKSEEVNFITTPDGASK